MTCAAPRAATMSTPAPTVATITEQLRASRPPIMSASPTIISGAVPRRRQGTELNAGRLQRSLQVTGVIGNGVRSPAGQVREHGTGRQAHGLHFEPGPFEGGVGLTQFLRGSPHRPGVERMRFSDAQGQRPYWRFWHQLSRYAQRSSSGGKGGDEFGPIGSVYTSGLQRAGPINRPSSFAQSNSRRRREGSQFRVRPAVQRR